MIGIIDVGGGLRGIYGAGVFDRCIDEKINFDYAIGVSAGSANCISYLAGQKGRNYRFYHEYSLRKEYMSISNFLKQKQYIDLDYIYSTLTNSNGEDPLDYDKVKSNHSLLTIVATQAQTGNAVYFTKNDISQNKYNVLKASSALPIVCKPYSINGIEYFDGGISDPVPVKKAIDDGCDKLVLILTRPLNYKTKGKRDLNAAKLLKKKYPALSQRLENRISVYNEGIDLALKLQQQGRCLIVAPDDLMGINTVSKDVEKLQYIYDKGYENASIIKQFISLDTFKG